MSGQMALWMELSRAIYLGGANKPDVGGHNPIEPLKLRKPIFSGPHYFNFLQLMDRLRQFDGVTIGASVKDLEAFWRAHLDGTAAPADWPAIDDVFGDVDRPLSETLDGVCELIMSGEDA